MRFEEGAGERPRSAVLIRSTPQAETAERGITRMDRAMRHIGVWIDREQAIVVEFARGGAPQTVKIESHAPGRVKIRGGMRGGGGHVDGASHTKAEAKRLASLDRFYDEVAAALEGADRIALIGRDPSRRQDKQTDRSSCGSRKFSGLSRRLLGCGCAEKPCEPGLLPLFTPWLLQRSSLAPGRIAWRPVPEGMGGPWGQRPCRRAIRSSRGGCVLSNPPGPPWMPNAARPCGVCEGMQ